MEIGAPIAERFRIVLLTISKAHHAFFQGIDFEDTGKDVLPSPHLSPSGSDDMVQC